ncbi:MAG TPA: S46 family peptidase, partial [Dehalococcoidia bacterium]|nr:S46 family peptidase [Dehalococcoidia bacterium]
APIYPELEKAMLADSLTFLATSLGAEHPLSRVVLAGRSPGDRAADLVSGTQLFEVSRRRALAEGGKEAVKASEDPLISLARAVDPYARALRREYEDLVQGVQREAYGNIARSLFALRGTQVYPDATFTLRLAFGVVKGWREEGRTIPYFTTLGGLYERHDAHHGKEPYNLPARWLEAKEKLDLSTHFNFVATPDIVGGNSGSPVVNRAGEVVGIIFDGNIHSLVLDLAYTEEKARAVAVCAEAIVEALRKVYAQEALAAEIRGAGQ